jgi:amino acid adenylation domain-containing protein/non-ribosomal peptide synthase protein (TIGR01720 family)
MRSRPAIEDVYPLTPMQQGMLFHTLLSPGSGVYFEQLVCRLRAPFDAAAFEQAWQRVLERHSILRTAFVWEGLERPLQVVHQRPQLPIEQHDWRGLTEAEQHARFGAFLSEDRERGFALGRAPLVRLTLIRLTDESYRFVCASHHLLLDGWSLSLVLRELCSHYAALSRGEALKLGPARPYRDYIEWLGRQDLAAAERFWRKALAGFTAPTSLGIERGQPAGEPGHAEHETILSPALTAALQAFAQSHQLTLNTVMQGIWAILLSRYSGQEDVLFGATVSGRPAELAGADAMVGLFINTLPVRMRTPAGAPLVPWLRELQARNVELRQYEHSPLVQIQGWSEVARGTAALFNSILVFENYPVYASLLEQSGPLAIGDVRVIERTNYPITVIVKPGRTSSVAISYDQQHFDLPAIERLAGHLKQLLESAVADPSGEVRIGELGMLSGEEREQLLRWNETAKRYPGGTVVEFFEQQAATRPDAVAVVFEEEELGYGELNARANQLARRLREFGVGPDVLVGLCLERSLELVVAVLGVLKAGGAYLPLEPEYPAQRLAYMLGDAKPRVLLTQERLMGVLPGVLPQAAGDEPPRATRSGETDARVWCLDRDWAEVEGYGTEDLPHLTHPENLAYCIYTSGSTGKPKGAVNTHAGLHNRLQWMQDAYRLTEADRVLQKTPFSFDVSVWEFLWPLASGAALVVARPGAHRDPAALREVINARGVTTLHFVPSMLQVFVGAGELGRCPSIRQVMCSGEALSYELQRQFLRGHPARLHDLYGPTEASIDVSYWECRDEGDRRSVPIGRPIANTALYILDGDMNPVPVGVAGELYIGGVGLARGYLNRPGLTAERFVPNPYATAAGERLYRTGDRVRYRTDGVIEYLGRLDHQVKVRGFRVELGEIEAALAQHEAIREVVVVAPEDQPGDRRLVAYYVGAGEVAGSELRAFLGQRLPEYMVPSAFVVLPAMPLSPNGKVDRKALPAPDRDRAALEVAYAAPRTASEEVLAGIWAQVLGVERVGIHDNFFELGGDSILSIQVIGRARQQGLAVTPKQLFEHQTVATLAAAAGSAEEAVTAEQGVVTGPVPLTPIQAWLFEQELPVPEHFNQSLLLEVQAGFRADLLRPVMERLLTHHDALRLRFRRGQGGAWEQEEAERETHDVVEVVDVSGLAEVERRAAIEAKGNELQGSLSLTEGPLLRVAYFDHGSGAGGRLLIAIHHLAIDGVSWRILLEDLRSGYLSLSRGEAVGLPPKTTSFKQWTERLREYAGSQELLGQVSHWTEQARGPFTAVPVDHPEGRNTSGSMRLVTVSLGAEETRDLLQEVPAVYRTQVNDLLLTALSQSLLRWAGGERVLIDLEGHGREDLFDDVDLSRTVGWFTSLFPVALTAGQGKEPGEAIKSTKEQLRRIPKKGIGYGILRYLQEGEAAEAVRAVPQAAVSFNYLGQADGISSGVFALAKESGGRERSERGERRHLLDVNAVVTGGQLSATWAYSEDVHERATVEAVAGSFMAELKALIAHCLSPEAGGYTPSDFPLAGLEQGKIDRLFGGERDIEDVYPLTPMQQGMLFHTLLSPGSGVYFEQLVCRLRAPFDAAAFEQAWQRVLERHSILRTAFVWEGLERPLQVVHQRSRLPRLWLPIEQHDWRGLSEVDQQARFDAFLSEDRERGFALGEAPLVRLTLVRLTDESYRFVCAFHHLLLDGWSVPLVLEELLGSYAALRRGEAPKLGPARPYRDYIEWLGRQDLAAAERFWRKALAGFTAPTSLGIECGRPVGESGHAERETVLSPELTAALQTFAQSHQLTLNTVMQGIWAILLGRYSGQDDVLFGATVSGRPADLAGSGAMVGLFINTLPVRVRTPAGAPLVPWLRELQAHNVELRQYEHSSLVQIQGWSEVSRGTAELFDCIFVFENFPVDASLRKQSGPLAVGDLRIIERTNYPITVVVKPGHRLSVAISYDRQRFDLPAIERLEGNLTTLLESFVADPSRRIGELEMLSAKEREQLLVKWNETAVPYPSGTVVDLIEEQVARRPGAVAVVLEDRRLTYGEVNARANRLARRLRELGVGQESLVGLSTERTPEMVVGVLGILKAGGAYLPLDPSYPRERLAFMLDDARVSVLVTQSQLAERLPVGGAEVVCLDSSPGAEGKALAGHAGEDLPRQSGPENLAYVIYTSGSTGRPKGVELAHSGLCNLATAQAKVFGVEPGDRVLQISSLSFDASIWELTMALTRGAALHLVQQDTLLSAEELASAIEGQGITAVTFPPSLLGTLPDDRLAGTMRTVVVAGEPCSRELAARWAPGRRFFNAYGPSESTVCATVHRCDEREPSSPPIGRPIANTRLYVLDGALRPLPVGVAGELYVGGAGLARGYRHRPDLTAERFVPDPFGAEPGSRLYRTGDRVRYRADGTIEYLGRLDHQVKVRGFRIELGEIEVALAWHEAIREVVVLAREDQPGDRRLVAYYVAAREVAGSELRAFLRQRLPEYMVPGMFVPLPAMPLSPNGKVDRKALPAPDRAALEVAYVAPRTCTEEVLTGIWAQVLGVERVGIHDNFFELGGHSLLATQIASRVLDALHVELPLRDLFEVRTVEELAKRLDAAKAGEAKAAEHSAIKPLPREPRRVRGSASRR